MKCISSLIQHKTKLAKRQSGWFSAVLLEVACKMCVGGCAELRGRSKGGGGEQQGRKSSSGTSLNGHRVSEVPHALGLHSWSSRARMSNAAPAHQPPQRHGQLNTCLEKPLSQRLFRLAGFKMFVSKIFLTYRRATSTWFLI